MARVRRKSPASVSAPPRLALGIVFFAFAAVVATGGALVRYYERRAPPVNPPRQGEVEIPAPELEPVKP
jgi:hypothetical protein